MKNNDTVQFTKGLLSYQNLDPESCYHRADLILKCYRKVVWSVKRHLSDTQKYAREACSQDYEAGLIYLSQFAPDIVKDEFAEKICCMLETQQIIKIVEQAAAYVREYPKNGIHLYDILYKTYLVKHPYTEKELLKELQICRNTYYKWKKEAEFIFALSLFGYTLPELMQEQWRAQKTKSTKKDGTKNGTNNGTNNGIEGGTVNMLY